MIFPLSLIVIFGGTIASLVLTICYHFAWYNVILITLGTFLGTVAFFCLLIMFLLIVLGKSLAKTYNPKGKFRWFFMCDVARFSCFWLGVRPKVEGLEKMPKDSTFVFYANHQSYLDMFIFYTVFKDYPHATMYKKIIDTYPLASGMARALGGIPIDREDDKDALKVIINIIKEVKSGVNFLVFPEGTRSKGIYLHPYKPGSFKIAQKACVPAVLLAIDGAYKPVMTFPFIRTRVLVKVVDVMYPNEWQDKNTIEMAKYAEEKVAQALDDARKKYRFLKPHKKYIRKEFE